MRENERQRNRERKRERRRESEKLGKSFVTTKQLLFIFLPGMTRTKTEFLKTVLEPKHLKHLRVETVFNTKNRHQEIW